MATSEMEYSIQEAAELLGIPIQKLRRWDEQGVLVALRTSGGHRRYSKELIDRLGSSGLSESADKTSKELATVKRALAEKRRIIQLLLESENRYRDLVETSHDLIWATDAQGRFTYLNTAAHDIFGLAPKDLIGRCFFNFEAGAAYISNRRFLAVLRRSGEVKNHVTHVRTALGEDRWIGINARLTNDDAGEVLGIRGTARDITDQHLAAARIEHLAMHDPLTDLPNRHSLQDHIESALAAGSVGSLLFIDIDHFKYVNDNFGHRSGDQLIVGVGSVLRDVTRACGGELYRLGGDEFAIHLPDALRKQASETAEAALDAVGHYRFHASDHKIVSNLTASCGIALYPFHGSELPSLFSNVDIAMYQAKELGRNRYFIFDQVSDSLRSTHKRIHWAKRLRDALDDDRLTLFAQPVTRLRDQNAMHHEILVRLLDDEGGFVQPSSFLDLAESLSLVQEIDLQVVEKLLLFMREHNQIGKKLRYFVNLSPVSISDQRWGKRFFSLLQNSGVDPSQLVFEITETDAMAEIDVTLTFVSRLKEMGCRFGLANFGTGFSSFYYLNRFDVDYLKIDGSFIRNLATDEGSRLFVRALNDVAKGLSKQVIAPNIESPEVVKLLKDMGTDYGQGFLFGKPVPLADTIQVAPMRELRARTA
ncbi:MAG TPA: EAL domain-containing protein [Burkholderiales bacterium]|nr:EAL domain-containing protein [Burkholderiales bacterium]